MDNLPFTGNWHHGNGVLVCGSLRIARADFDTRPPQPFQDFTMDWICETLNAEVKRRTDAFRPCPFPEKDRTKTPEEQGLYRKFNVCRVDKQDLPGTKHYMCHYFVLDMDHDPAAPAALRAYAVAVESTHPVLAKELRDKYGNHNDDHYRLLHCKVLDLCVAYLHYFDKAQEMGISPERAALEDALHGGVNRYTNDVMFNARVKCLTAAITSKVMEIIDLTGYRHAYEGTREELLIWKKRALEAEATLRERGDWK